jgi:hypothetical protein
MQKLHFSIQINAPAEKVWKTMLDDKTYRQWTEPFGKGGYFEGTWETGSDMRFLGPSDKGTPSGMLSRIKESRPYEFISIEHVGILTKGVEDTTSEMAKSWSGALENYTLKEIEGKTELSIDTDTAEEFAEEFSDMWPKALQKLKEIAEK